MVLTDYALFAKDSYERSETIGFPDIEGAEFNGAEIISSSKSNDGFYAIAYNTGEKILIAYRGTDNLLEDFLGGYAGGGGYPFTSQHKSAIDFYHSVQAANPGIEIELTGHSLGGGLAGFVSGITGSSAYVFDNMTYELSTKVSYFFAKLAEFFTDITGITAAEIDDAVGDVISSFGFGVNINSRGRAEASEALSSRTRERAALALCVRAWKSPRPQHREQTSGALQPVSRPAPHQPAHAEAWLRLLYDQYRPGSVIAKVPETH